MHSFVANLAHFNHLKFVKLELVHHYNYKNNSVNTIICAYHLPIYGQPSHLIKGSKFNYHMHIRHLQAIFISEITTSFIIIQITVIN